jgi:ATP-dependent RNA helicase DDX54/DBP10
MEKQNELVPVLVVWAGFGPRYKHKQERAPKEADKYRDDYHVRKKRVAEAKEARIGKYKEGAGKREIKSTEDIRKERKLAERKKAKNARPSKKGKR